MFLHSDGFGAADCILADGFELSRFTDVFDISKSVSVAGAAEKLRARTIFQALTVHLIHRM